MAVACSFAASLPAALLVKTPLGSAEPFIDGTFAAFTDGRAEFAAGRLEVFTRG